MELESYGVYTIRAADSGFSLEIDARVREYHIPERLVKPFPELDILLKHASKTA